MNDDEMSAAEADVATELGRKLGDIMRAAAERSEPITREALLAHLPEGSEVTYNDKEMCFEATVRLPPEQRMFLVEVKPEPTAMFVPDPMTALFAFAKKAQAEATAAGITLPMTGAELDGCTWGDPKAREGTTITYCPASASTGHAWLITSEDGGGSGNTAAAAVERARANGVAV